MHGNPMNIPPVSIAAAKAVAHTGRTPLFVLLDGVPEAIFAAEDALRDEAGPALDD